MKNIVLVFLISLTLPSLGQVNQTSINDLSFMTGKWTLTHEWGDMEEIWNAPMGDNITSTFRCVKNGRVVFYEFMVIEQMPSGPVMMLRHFKKGSIGWEDKDKPYLMPAIRMEKNEVVFESEDKAVKITYKRKNAKSLDCVLDEKGKDGKWKQDVFNYQLAK